MPSPPIAAAASTAAPADSFIARTDRSPAHLDWTVITAFSSSENNIAAGQIGSNCAISHDPLTFFIVARTVVGLVTGAGGPYSRIPCRRTTARRLNPGANPRQPPAATLAVVVTCCCCAAAAKIWSVKCV